jgi:hypothetical protein
MAGVAGCGAGPALGGVPGGADVPGMYSELANVTRQSAAKSTLNGLMVWLGEAGLRAAALLPALAAAVDQHGASVRDALGDPEAGPHAVPLAGYATGLRDALIESEWQLAPLDDVDWERAEWPTVRLLAICALARSHGYA